MTMNIYSVKDVKVAFAQPFFLPNDDIAKRAFAQNIMSSSDEQKAFKADFELWRLGSWDDNIGKMYQDEDGPVYLMSGKDVTV